MSDSESNAPQRRWWQHPLVPCAAVAVLLVAVGDAYPLSPFPMYSNIDTSANMLLVTNEKDEALPLSRLFNSGSAQLKKRFEKELQDQTGTREYQDVKPEQQVAAGQAFLRDLWAGRDKGDVAKLPAPPQVLRLKIRTMTMNGTEFGDTIHPIADLAVTGEGGEP